MDVRDMRGNPGIWEELSWVDLSSREKELGPLSAGDKINGMETTRHQVPIKFGMT